MSKTEQEQALTEIREIFRLTHINLNMPDNVKFTLDYDLAFLEAALKEKDAQIALRDRAMVELALDQLCDHTCGECQRYNLKPVPTCSEYLIGAALDAAKEE